MSEQQYDNEGKGRLWKQESANPKSPIFSGELMVNGKLWRLVVWPESIPQKGGKAYNRVNLEEPKQKGGNYYNSPEPTAPPLYDRAPKNTSYVYVPKEYPPMKSALQVEEQERLERMDDIPF